MSYLIQMLDKFKDSATGSRYGVKVRHTVEESRLEQAVQETSDAGVKMALLESVAKSQKSSKEVQRIYESLVNFSSSLEGLLTSVTSHGSSCDSLSCGSHASCTLTTSGAECICDEGYVGLGATCYAPPEFRPHPLVIEGLGGAPTQAADINVCVFGHKMIAVVFRDISKGNVGRVVVGKVREAGQADLAPPEQFTSPGGKAYSPVVTGTTNRIAIAWRDEIRLGKGFLRGAEVGSGDVRGADLALTWGDQVNFCTDQAHKMSMLAFPNNRVMVLFSDQVKATEHTPAESFGNSMLAEIGSTGGITNMGTFRFTEYNVSHLEAVKVTNTGFVVAARAAPAIDDMNVSLVTKQEAIAMYGEIIGDNLAFHPKPLNIEPNRSQIWARGVSLIAPNTFAYAYQDGEDQKIQMAVAKIDALTHRMEIIQPPVTVHNSVSPYVSMLSVPYSPTDPHTLLYYQGVHGSVVNLCAWTASDARLDNCEDFTLMPETLTSVSGAHLGGGKAFMAFVPQSGEPYYTIFGVAK
jgi:hypothetical protein